MNVLAIVLIVGLAFLIVYEVISLVRSILDKRKAKKVAALEEDDDKKKGD